MLHPTFQDKFFARPMHQVFNAHGDRFQSDEAEPAVVKWVRATSLLN